MRRLKKFLRKKEEQKKVKNKIEKVKGIKINSHKRKRNEETEYVAEFKTVEAESERQTRIEPENESKVDPEMKVVESEYKQESDDSCMGYGTLRKQPMEYMIKYYVETELE